MTEVELVFEEPPRRVQRSPYHPFLRALAGAPATEDTDRGKATRYARVSNPEGLADLDEREAITIASAMKNAAKAIPGTFEVTSRSIPGTGKHGVWARFIVDPQVAAHAEAQALVAEARDPRVPVIPAASTEVDLDPVGADVEAQEDWEFPESESVQVLSGAALDDARGER